MNTFRQKNSIAIYAVFSFLLITFSGCATYYQKNEDLMTAVYTNNFNAANKILQNDEKWEKQERNRLLFYLNKGTVLWMQGDYAGSKTYFAKADLFIEDHNKTVGDAVLTMLVNAKMSTYLGENFEQILLHYYSALNYLALGQTDDALVEGKRMLAQMQRITDKYESKNKYRRDAFAHNLLGIIYEMQGEYNDAFIAYKNAYEVYKDDYQTALGTPVPLQLKKDILRTAKASGFYEEVRHFEAEFGMQAEDINRDKGDLVFFWNNGLGPVKDELSITVLVVPLGDGWVEFVNLEYGIRFPFKTSGKDQHKDFLDMKAFRFVLPKYISRVPYYQNARLNFKDTSYGFQLAEDINAIAYKSLEDRIGREIAVALARVALKQLAVYQANNQKDEKGKKKNEGLAAALMIYSLASEQADTRNWQLLPYSINYTRMSLDTGQQCFRFEAFNKDNVKGANKEYEVQIKKGATSILAVQTIEFSGFKGK